MTELSFSAIGTEWAILIDEPLKTTQQTEILRACQRECERIDHKFSRFIRNSWLNELSQHTSGRYPLDDEAAFLFTLGKQLETLTDGLFTLNIAHELAALGYDAEYSLQAKTHTYTLEKGTYVLEETGTGIMLGIQGRVGFDLGAFGKGYLIDQLSEILRKFDLEFFLVDGSGDFFGTTKADGTPWNIGLEHPRNPTQVIGTYPLRHSGFAASGITQRHWAGVHHLLNGVTGQPAPQKEMVFVAAKTATLADALSTAHFVTTQAYQEVLEHFAPHKWRVIENNADQRDHLVFRASTYFEGTLYRDK